MASAFEAKLAAAKAAHRNLCVGVDPDPKHVQKIFGRAADPLVPAEVIHDYAVGIVKNAGECAAAFKLNYEFFADYDPELLEAVLATIRTAWPDALVILDRKYGDIGKTTARSVAFATRLGVDAVTVNPYMGIDDTLGPFRAGGIGCFALCLTTNPGASQFQRSLMTMPVAGALHKTMPMFAHVARLVEERHDPSIGLVVGGTSTRDFGMVRDNAPRSAHLIPGPGTQGADLDAIIGEIRQHQGCSLVNVGGGIAEASDDINLWPATLASRAKFYHESMRPS